MAEDTRGSAEEPVQGTTVTPEGEETAEAGSAAVGGEPPQSFDREYVEALRSEAAANRVAARRAEALEAALREATLREGAGAVLQDVSDLAWSQEFLDEDGLPSVEAVRAAAEELAERKPHLGRVRGDIGQGKRSADGGEAFSLAAALRGNA